MKALNAFNGTLRATPSSRRLTAAGTPTTNAIPSVCTIRTPGNANSDSDSRIQVLSALASTISNADCPIMGAHYRPSTARHLRDTLNTTGWKAIRPQGGVLLACQPRSPGAWCDPQRLRLEGGGMKRRTFMAAAGAGLAASGMATS